MKYFVSKNICFENSLKPGGILVNNGKIQEIILIDYLDYPKNISSDIEVTDFGSNVLMAGLFDSHVHVNEPGRTSWEGYSSATKAAAAGGVTSIIDMPLNSIPPTTTVENLYIKKNSTNGKLYVDLGFWGGLISGNSGHLEGLTKEGVVGFKCFMCPSGVDEFPNVEGKDIINAINILENSETVLSFHAETNEQIDVTGDPTKYSTFLKTRPENMEIEAIKKIIDLATNHNVKIHIVHLSSANALPLIKKAKENGIKLTVETCYHYLCLNSENIPDKMTQFKCCPPIRNNENKEILWTALKNNLIDQIVSDHSPCTPDLKCLEEGDFLKAWGGISSLQFGLSLFWTEARNRGFKIWDVSKFLSCNPAKLCGFHTQKGVLKKGMDADFVVWNPDEEYEITTDIIFHKNKLTPYLGKRVYGKVLQTIVRGETVFQNGAHLKPTGQLLLKK